MHHVWGLPVALDLFFAGLGAGLFLVAVMADLFGGERYEGVRRVGGILAPWPVILGVLLLVVDLGNPLRFYEFVLKSDISFPLLNYSPSSVMSTGTWLLVFFVSISLGYFVLSLIRWPFAWDEKLRKAVGVVGLPFALLVTIYTGVLIAATSIPVWNTVMLPLLFVSSAMLAGLAGIIFFLGLRPVVGLAPTEESALARLERGQSALAVVVLVLSLIFVGLVVGRPGGSGLIASVYGALWWFFAIGLGLVVPLVAGFIRKKGALALVSPVVAFLAVLGAFFMRYAILMAGQVS